MTSSPALTAATSAGRASRGRKPLVPFEAAFALLKEFAAANGHANPTRTTTSPDGFALGGWVARQRTKRTNGTLAQAEFAALRDLGVAFPSERGRKDPSLLQQIGAQVSEQVWAERLGQVDAFIAAHGHARISLDHVTDGGVALGTWTGTVRRLRRNGLVGKDRVADLDARGFDWDPTPGRKDYTATFAARLACLDGFVAKYGHASPTKDYICQDKGCERPDLGQWVLRTRKKYKGTIAGPLSDEQVRDLNARGFVWTPGRGAAARRP